ncbi:MAG: Asp-tRNA(Asn)/Glu-tRNA(Gln) amidotransferase subunit GatA [Clostridia bacterium]|nr:Asp-tRNA(Asn)/Glu-tRNA(Gln) amidotransferase subunit GatA [Clostridia bacterium]
MALWEETVRSLGALLAGRRVTPREVAAAFLDRVAAVDGLVRAFLHVDAEAAARAAHDGWPGPRGPLDGIPFGIKDNIVTRGMPTTCASRILAGYVPPYDATVVERLAAAGSVPLGKLNMDEFAMGSSCENSAFFPTRNPWDLDAVPGGSSGGSAAAVAAGMVPFALGSDTGGSIRQPAAFCGVVGLKPTYGRVSRYGLVAFASSLDQIGPITWDVTDCALVLQAIAGHDPRDATSAGEAVPDYVAALEPDVRGLRVGVPEEFFGPGVEAGVRDRVRRAIDLLADLGASVEPCSLPHTPYALPAYYLIAPAEASSNLARYDGVRYGWRAPGEGFVDMYRRTRREGFGAEVRRRIMLGTFALSAGYYDAYYRKAQEVRTLVRRDFQAAFQRFDLLATPTAPTVAFRLGERVNDPVAMYQSDICTIPVNLAGLPAISVPCGFVDGLPVGLQLIGRPFGEPTLLRAAYAYEQHAGLRRRRPLRDVSAAPGGAWPAASAPASAPGGDAR